MRSKHCQTCQHCVRRYDHHCPWIENCVGEKNHRWFVLYLAVQLLVLLWGLHIAWWVHRHRQSPLLAGLCSSKTFTDLFPLVSSGRGSVTCPPGSCGFIPTACCWPWPCCWLCSRWSCCSCSAPTSTWFLSTPPPGSSCRATVSPTSSTVALMKTPSTAAPSTTFGVSSACGAQWCGNRCTSGRAATKSNNTHQVLTDWKDWISLMKNFSGSVDHTHTWPQTINYPCVQFTFVEALVLCHNISLLWHLSCWFSTRAGLCWVYVVLLWGQFTVCFDAVIMLYDYTHKHSAFWCTLSTAEFAWREDMERKDEQRHWPTGHFSCQHQTKQIFFFPPAVTVEGIKTLQPFCLIGQFYIS